jgi:hypothetical protein
MRKRVDLEHPEDTTMLAGWMYTDLLLGLMVVFLATISLVPNDNFMGKSLSKETKIKVDKAFNLKRGIALVYDKFDAAVIEKDIDELKKREGLNKDAEIIFAQILGGYDPKSESVEIGRNRALIYSFALNAKLSALFGRASVTAGGEPGLEPGQIGLRLTFAAKIK